MNDAGLYSLLADTILVIHTACLAQHIRPWRLLAAYHVRLHAQVLYARTLSEIMTAMVTDRAYAWVINGFASVMSASLATLLAIEFGITAVVLLALSLYLTAAAIIRN